MSPLLFLHENVADLVPLPENANLNAGDDASHSSALGTIKGAIGTIKVDSSYSDEFVRTPSNTDLQYKSRTCCYGVALNLPLKHDFLRITQRWNVTNTRSLSNSRRCFARRGGSISGALFGSLSSFISCARSCSLAFCISLLEASNNQLTPAPTINNIMDLPQPPPLILRIRTWLHTFTEHPNLITYISEQSVVEHSADIDFI